MNSNLVKVLSDCAYSRSYDKYLCNSIHAIHELVLSYSEVAYDVIKKRTSSDYSSIPEIALLNLLIDEHTACCQILKTYRDSHLDEYSSYKEDMDEIEAKKSYVDDLYSSAPTSFVDPNMGS